MAGAPCLPCGGGSAAKGVKQQVSGRAGGGISMQRTSAVQRTWIVTCPNGESKEVVGDLAAHKAASACSGSLSAKT